MRLLKSQNGLTLIEILIVVVILGVLAWTMLTGKDPGELHRLKPKATMEPPQPTSMGPWVEAAERDNFVVQAQQAAAPQSLGPDAFIAFAAQAVSNLDQGRAALVYDRSSAGFKASIAKAEWFNPRNGQRQAAQAEQGRFRAPDGQDWGLVLGLQK